MFSTNKFMVRMDMVKGLRRLPPLVVIACLTYLQKFIYKPSSYNSYNFTNTVDNRNSYTKDNINLGSYILITT